MATKTLSSRLGKAVIKYQAIRNEAEDHDSCVALDEIVQNLKLLENVSQEPRTRENVIEAMSVTCWGSLAFCCGLEKRCMWRNLVMEVIGMKKKEYQKLKDKFTEEILLDRPV
ncbi:unnamed protein product [marine sediment metagenome]|uniref:Uncharacterized protein n=1 Tax=marine sediment metagenome TaxID=412755 RepID=X1R1G1_9ZZZZ